MFEAWRQDSDISQKTIEELKDTNQRLEKESREQRERLEKSLRDAEKVLKTKDSTIATMENEKSRLNELLIKKEKSASVQKSELEASRLRQKEVEKELKVSKEEIRFLSQKVTAGSPALNEDGDEPNAITLSYRREPENAIVRMSDALKKVVNLKVPLPAALLAGAALQIPPVVFFIRHASTLRHIIRILV